ncbi:hypothetical protein K7W42_19225 [Deinococcus sp. HMF7604]|uniref:hypothetical protein n=1 Tax=Deinococcus betulae TaxID=2873312 RepID=UPI001CC9C67B|nr:hypothetical protein [Deinococcus betulae]MBZ9752973.1 hypothetical protein [Deinococcus betulae]
MKEVAIRPGQFPHLLLSMACAHPLPVRDLANRVTRRHGAQPASRAAALQAACRLCRAGWLAAARVRLFVARAWRWVQVYVLTPAGEELLDDLAAEVLDFSPPPIWRQAA